MKQTIQPGKLFTASCIALVATSMTFAIRANLIESLGKTFSLSNSDLGIVFGTAFWGFTISMIIGGTLCDMLGMKRLIYLAFAGHVTGILLTAFAQGFWSLFFSTLLVGMANGLVEAACNPLVATIYPDKKTEKLNLFHVWFPGGIVIGGLTGYFMSAADLSWQWQLATILIPTALYGLLFLNLEFPETERVQSGTSAKQMIAECARPLFIFMVICMVFTAATELGTNQWISELLGNVKIVTDSGVKVVPGILLLVFINGLMAAGRSLAGKIVHTLSPAGMLMFSAFFSAAGLIGLSYSGGLASFGAAAVFAIGICFFWPTMLGFVSEFLPRTGALGLSIMGAAGMLSVSFILPVIGSFYEDQTQQNLPQGVILAAVKNAVKGTTDFELLQQAKLTAGSVTLGNVAYLPAILFIAFTLLLILRNKYIKQETAEN
jgi:MFS family permease